MLPKKLSGPSLSIRYALPGLLALLILSAVGLTGWQSYRSGVASVESLAKRLNLEVTQRIEGRILSFVELPNIFHEMNKAALISTDTGLDEFDVMRKLFWDEVYISKSAPYLYYGTEDGYFLGIDTSYKGRQAVFKTRNAETEPNRVTYALSPEGEIQDELEAKEYDPRVRDWYTAAVEANKLTWSPIYVFSALKELGISPVIPVKDAKGKLVGVLGIDLTLGELSNFLHSLEISENGEAFIIEPDGNMVATSTLAPPYKIVDEKQDRLNILENESNLLRITAEHLMEKYGSFENIDQVEQVTFDRDGETYYAQVSRLMDNDLDWLIVVVIPARDFMGPVYDNLRTTAYFGIVGLILSAALGFILAGWIIRPVFTVTDVAASIEDEKWELGPLDIVADRTDELGQLARVFSKMAKELHAREKELRRQVRALSIQIDQAKRESAVKEIVENDFFKDLQAKAAQMRQRTEDDEKKKKKGSE